MINMSELKTLKVKVFDKDGMGYDLCEVEVGSVRILRVLESYRPTSDVKEKP